jgi:methyl-accepting chemotaxis protein
MPVERKKVLVHSFQTKLTLRIAMYLVLFFLVFVNLLFCWKMLSEGPYDPAQQFVETLEAHLPVLTCLLILVPIMAWDTIRFSHRLVGPLVRFRKTMQAITAGEAVRPIKLREGDYLGEMRDDFNHMLEALQKQGVEILKPVDAQSEQAESQQRSA